MKKINLGLILGCIICAAICGCNKSNLTVKTNQTPALHIPTSSGNFSSGIVNINYYVSIAIGNDNYTGTSPTVGGTSAGKTIGPFKTINHAASLTVPNDVVNIIADGEYNSTSNPPITSYSLVEITRSGSSAGPITYQGYNGKPVIHVKQTDNFNTAAVMINASYINFNNITVYGDANVETPPAAGDSSPKYTVNGISIGGMTSITPFIEPTYVSVTNCTVHDVPGAGISAIQSDNITFISNEVYENCFYSGYNTSGISVLTPVNVTANGDKFNPKIIVSNNISHDNKCIVANYSSGKITDGNGIIIDVNITDRAGNASGIYNGFTRVENNISYNNGGGGIQLTKAHNVYLNNNTAYHNAQFLTAQSEMGSVGSYGNFYSNNIMFPKTNTSNYNIASTPGSPAPAYAYNVYYNGTGTVTPNMPDPFARIGDPKFVGPLPAYGTVTTVANSFKLQLYNGSTAINAGRNDQYCYFATKDYSGASRPTPGNGLVDIGAFESLF